MASPDRNDVVISLKQYVLDKFLPGEDPAALAEDTPLITSRVLDSIATLQLVSFVEEKFGISVAAHEASGKFNTIADIADLVASKKQ
jgi:acyl carrier protein